MQSASLFLVKLLVRLFALLPFPVLYFFSDVFFLFLFHVLRYRRRAVQLNLSKSFPEKSKPEIAKLTRRYYHYLCDLVLESVKGLTLPRQELQRRFHFRNPEIFSELYQKKRSALLLGSHFGNWEWGTLSFPLAVQHTVVGIYKPLKNKKLDSYLQILRKQWGLHLASMAKAGRAVIKYRDRPSIFVLIADQTPVDVANAHWLDFLNQDTPFLHGAAKLAQRTGYPVFYFEIQCVKRGFYEVDFHKICEAGENLKPVEITARFASMLETAIEKNPPFWLWSHRRWKRKRP